MKLFFIGLIALSSVSSFASNPIEGAFVLNEGHENCSSKIQIRITQIEVEPGLIISFQRSYGRTTFQSMVPVGKSKNDKTITETKLGSDFMEIKNYKKTLFGKRLMNEQNYFGNSSPMATDYDLVIQENDHEKKKVIECKYKRVVLN